MTSEQITAPASPSSSAPEPDRPRRTGGPLRPVWPGVLALGVLLYVFSVVATEHTLTGAVPVVIYAIAALGLNVLVGTTGIISLGAPAFFGVGAFSVAYLTGTRGWPFLLAALVGVAASALVSLPLVPIAGRLKGVYLAIATSGIVFLGLHVFRTADGITGGISGRPVPAATIGPLHIDSATGFFRFAGVVLVLVTIITLNLLRSRTGRALRTLETSTIAARSLGMSPLRFRSVALVFSSALAGLAGALLAAWQQFVIWDQFQFAILGSLIAIIVIGGRGSVYGTLVGAIVVIGLPDLIENLSGSLPFIAEDVASPGITPGAFAAIISGLLIVVVVVYEPGGLAELGRRLVRFAQRGAPVTAGLLEVDDLEVRYGKAVQGLAGVTLRVPQGEIVALLGPNGAGKTTMLRATTGLLGLHKGRIIGGDVRLADRSIVGVPSAALVRDGIAQALEGRRLFRRLTVEENLLTGATTVRGRKHARQSVESVMERIPFLGQRRHTVTGLLSGGEQQQVAIGRAITSNPRLLVLDEPSLGLAPIMVRRIAELLAELRGDGLTILLVEQNAEMALSLASYGYVLTAGRTALEGAASDLRNDPRMADLYLGREAAAIAHEATA